MPSFITQLTDFFRKYKGKILYWAILLIIIFWFTPQQRDYYLNTDIELFKTKYFYPVLAGIWVALSLLIISLTIIKKRSLKRTIITSVTIPLLLACVLYITRDTLLSGALFMNRLHTRGESTKTYILHCMIGQENTKEGFVPYDVDHQTINIEEKLKERLYHPGYKKFDTVRLSFKKGLWGVDFQPTPFAK